MSVAPCPWYPGSLRRRASLHVSPRTRTIAVTRAVGTDASPSKASESDAERAARNTTTLTLGVATPRETAIPCLNKSTVVGPVAGAPQVSPATDNPRTRAPWVSCPPTAPAGVPGFPHPTATAAHAIGGRPPTAPARQSAQRKKNEREKSTGEKSGGNGRLDEIADDEGTETIHESPVREGRNR